MWIVNIWIFLGFLVFGYGLLSIPRSSSASSSLSLSVFDALVSTYHRDKYANAILNLP